MLIFGGVFHQLGDGRIPHIFFRFGSEKQLSLPRTKGVTFTRNQGTNDEGKHMYKSGSDLEVKFKQ